MRRITLQQIEELPENEKLQLGAYINHYLNSLYERMNHKSEAKKQIELGVNEDGKDNRCSSLCG